MLDAPLPPRFTDGQPLHAGDLDALADFAAACAHRSAALSLSPGAWCGPTAAGSLNQLSLSADRLSIQVRNLCVIAPGGKLLLVAEETLRKAGRKLYVGSASATSHICTFTWDDPQAGLHLLLVTDTGELQIMVPLHQPAALPAAHATCQALQVACVELRPTFIDHGLWLAESGSADQLSLLDHAAAIRALERVGELSTHEPTARWIAAVRQLADGLRAFHGRLLGVASLAPPAGLSAPLFDAWLEQRGKTSEAIPKLEPPAPDASAHAFITWLEQLLPALALDAQLSRELRRRQRHIAVAPSNQRRISNRFSEATFALQEVAAHQLRLRFTHKISQLLIRINEEDWQDVDGTCWHQREPNLWEVPLNVPRDETSFTLTVKAPTGHLRDLIME